MNSYQRYISMIKGQKTDIVPRIPILMHFAADYIKASYADFCRDYKTMVKANVALIEDFKFDQLDVMSDPYCETTAFGGKITYLETTVPACTHPMADTMDFSVLGKPDLSAKRVVERINAIKAYKDYAFKKYSITGWVEGPAAQAATVRGVEQFLMDLIIDESFVCELMDKCLDFAIKFALAQIASGCDTIGIGDAIASQVNPDLYERLILPRQKQLVNAIHESGGLARMHICGNIDHLLSGLATLELDIIDVDWMVDIVKVREVLGSNITLAGNLNPVEDVLRGNPDSVRESLKAIYKKVGNPYFVNAGCEIPRGTPIENLYAFCDPIEYQA